MGITRFARNDLARLSYEIDGPDTGDVVVMLHTTLADRGSFQAIGLVTDAELFLSQLVEELDL